jgi:hypothetical protein
VDLLEVPALSLVSLRVNLILLADVPGAPRERIKLRTTSRHALIGRHAVLECMPANQGQLLQTQRALLVNWVNGQMKLDVPLVVYYVKRENTTTKKPK